MIRIPCQGRIFRRQWLALRLVAAACHTVRAEVKRTPAHLDELTGLEDGMDLDQLLRLVDVARDRCEVRFECVGGKPGERTVSLCMEQQRAIHKRVRKIGREIERTWPSRDHGNEIPARAWLNVVLLVIEDVAAQVPPNPPERRADWKGLRDAFVDLYQAYDPQFDHEEIEAGAQAGERIKEIVFG